MANTRPSTFVNYCSYTQQEDIKRLKFITAAVESKHTDGLSVLEVGCGNGNICFQLAKYGHKVLGMDISSETILTAQALHSHPNLEYRVIDVESFVSDREFDVIVCSEVLEHLYEPAKVLLAISERMKSVGIAIVTVPNGHGMREMLVTRQMQYLARKNNMLTKTVSSMMRMLGYNGYSSQTSAADLTHIQFFSLRDIQRLAHSCRLTITKIGAANFIEKVFPWSLFCKHSSTLQKFDCWVADMLPIRWSSGFNMVMQKQR